jgi:Tol biopolymer transport system component
MVGYDHRMTRAVVASAAAFVAAGLVVSSAPLAGARQAGAPPTRTRMTFSEERHLKNLTQLTDDGQNAEAYFSPDGRRLIFQSTRGGRPCDQIDTMAIDGSDVRMVSTGRGRTTCSFYYPDGKHILYASTHLGSPSCPPPADQSKGYVWAIYDSYDIFRADVDGKNLVRLTTAPGYDAEATIGADGRIVFTSVRDGDMEIYSMNGDGSDVRRLTHLPGPDGGPFFSPDGSQIVFRGYHPPPGPALDDFRSLLKIGLWRPTEIQVFVMDRDGGHLRQVTNYPGANWAPSFTPDSKKIIFASNMKEPKGPNFDLYLINLDGTGLEQVTFSPDFDGFPMFSPDGRKLVFGSNRHASEPHMTNVFIADWVW